MIRRATPDDARAVADIFNESRAEAMPWLPALHTIDEHVEWFGEQLAGEAYVLEENGVPVGYAVLHGDELHDLYVAPQAQRRGVGSALFAHVQTLRPEASISGLSGTTPGLGPSTTPAVASSWTRPRTRTKRRCRTCTTSGALAAHSGSVRQVGPPSPLLSSSAV